MISNESLLPRAEEYAKSNGTKVIRQPMLGHGSDGAVWRTQRDTAIKILAKQTNFRNELECYWRFKAANIRKLDGFAVPYLEGFNAALMAIEMTIVEPPYLLDFGKVHIDKPPPYHGDRQLTKNTFAQWRDLYGKDWLAVRRVVSTLQSRFGIYYVDPRPANICFRHENDEDGDDEWMREPPPNDPDQDDG